MRCLTAVLVTVALLVGCASQDGIVRVVVEGDSPVASELKEVIRANPVVTDSKTGIEYKLELVEVDPTIDPEIAVQPDASIDYKILVQVPGANGTPFVVTNPNSGREVTTIPEWLESTLETAIEKR